MTLKPQQNKGKGGNEAYLQLYPARDYRGASALERQLLNWQNQDPREHFDDSQEGKRLQNSAQTYPWGQVFTFNYDQRNPPPGTPVAVDIFGDWIPAEIRAEPLYDPSGERVRA